MTAGGALSAACFGLISIWRWQDGQVGWALAFAALALVQLALTVRRGRAARAVELPSRSTSRQVPAPDSAAVAHARQHRPGWVVIAVGGLVASVVMAVVLPIASFVLAGLAAYAAWRARAYGQLLANASAAGPVPA